MAFPYFGCCCARKRYSDFFRFEFVEGKGVENESDPRFYSSRRCDNWHDKLRQLLSRRKIKNFNWVSSLAWCPFVCLGRARIVLA